MRILCFGKSGLVASELQQWLPELNSDELKFLSRQDCDITNASQVESAINEFKPSHVINAAAYTAVDAAEDDTHQCNLVNGFALEGIAKAVNKVGAILIHFSTDYVFNGKQVGSYEEDDIPCPINIYGKSKLLGEELIQKHIVNYYILRVQWVYGHANSNFVDAIIKKAKSGEDLQVINDQYGSPTSAEVIAKAVVNLITNHPAFGVYNFRTLNQTTWYDFASYILDYLNLKVSISPVGSEVYKTKAKRPKNSVMNIGKWIYSDLYTPPSWKVAVENYLNQKKEIKES